MGLCKYGKKGYEDISDWTSTMIVAKIREIEYKKEEARKEYIDTCALWDKQIEYLQNAISNRGLCSDDTES